MFFMGLIYYVVIQKKELNITDVEDYKRRIQLKIDGCKNDIQLCQKYLKPNIAYSGHDYASSKHIGVKQAVDEIFGQLDKVFIDKSWLKFA